MLALAKARAREEYASVWRSGWVERHSNMDVREALQQLYAEKKRLEDVIASLELLVKNSESESVAPRSRRGRKSMGPEERRKVSERMKKYWADRHHG